MSHHPDDIRAARAHRDLWRAAQALRELTRKRAEEKANG